jgi:hypothetical protein
MPALRIRGSPDDSPSSSSAATAISSSSIFQIYKQITEVKQLRAWLEFRWVTTRERNMLQTLMR